MLPLDDVISVSFFFHAHYMLPTRKTKKKFLFTFGYCRAGLKYFYSLTLWQVSYNNGLRHFTVHSYPLKKGSCGLSCFIKPRRSRKDFCLLYSTREEAVQWVGGFADQQCFVNCLPHPLVSSKK